MEGITIIKDETNNKRYIQIDMELIEKNEPWEDFIDGIIATMRKEEEDISWDKVQDILKEDGKI